MPQTSRKVPRKVRCRQCATLNPPSGGSCSACGAQLAGRASSRVRRGSILAALLAPPLAKKLLRSLSALAEAPITHETTELLKRMKETSQEALFADFAMLEELWETIMRQFDTFAPSVPTAIERLAQLETHLVEVTGIDSPAVRRPGAPITEELHWLRDRLEQAAKDGESVLRIRHSRDLNQMIDSVTAAMRFTIAAVAIVRLSLEMFDRLNPKRVARSAFGGEAP